MNSEDDEFEANEGDEGVHGDDNAAVKGYSVPLPEA